GDVVVTYNGHKSNSVQITSWRLAMTTSNIGPGSLQTNSSWSVHLRTMLNSLRTAPDGPTAPPPYNANEVEGFGMADSTASLSIGGSYNTTGLGGDPVTVTVSPQTAPSIPFFESNPPPAPSATAAGIVYTTSPNQPLFALTFSAVAPNATGQALDHT